MDDDLDLRNFSGVSPLFPLPGVVMFPHAVLPLHIFEPRYRQMTEDTLADDKVVTIVQLRPSSAGAGAGAGAGFGSPPVEEVGCLGKILRHERLPDGRFNFLLLGRKRVRLVREVAHDRLYRSAEVEILDDVYDGSPEGARRAELTGLFRHAFQRRGGLDAELSDALEASMPLGVLTDIVAHAMGLPPEIKQLLLADPRVTGRADILLTILRQMLSPGSDATPPARPFPPPFSPN